MIEAKKKKEFENNTKVNCLRIYYNIRFNNIKMRRVTVPRLILNSVGDPTPFFTGSQLSDPSRKSLAPGFINFFYRFHLKSPGSWEPFLGGFTTFTRPWLQLPLKRFGSNSPTLILMHESKCCRFACISIFHSGAIYLYYKTQNIFSSKFWLVL